jgi:hypothetical protein
MALFSKRNSPDDHEAVSLNGSSAPTRMPVSGDLRIRNAGRWPLRVTDFYLDEAYEQPPVEYLEIFYVRSGSFLHESDAGRQTQRDGAVIISHPHNRHLLKHVENCHLTRVRVLPEWLTPDFSRLVTAEFAVSAIFGRTWFDLPDRDSVHVFDTRPERRRQLISDLDLMRDLLLELGEHEPSGDERMLLRASAVRFLLQIGVEFGNFLRRRGGVTLNEECHHFLRRVEWLLTCEGGLSAAEGGARTQVPDSFLSDPGLFLKAIPSGKEELEPDVFAERFQHETGLHPDEYLLRRRLDHAAHRLLTSEERTGKIATSLGFENAAGLSKPFELRYRVSPAVYRQKFSSAWGVSAALADAGSGLPT